MSGEDTAMDKAQANDFLNGLLNQPLRMTVTDGRSFIGNFMCTDRDAAVILSDTWEYRGNDKRFVGLVVVPGRHTVKIETDVDAYA